MTNFTEHQVIEAQRIYKSIFKKPIQEPLITRFLEASQTVIHTVNDEQAIICQTALERNLDLEALEIAARRSRKLKLLSDKFRLMIYLAETLPDHQQYYVNSKSSWLGGISAILIGGVRTSFKLIKGTYLLKKPGNV